MSRNKNSKWLIIAFVALLALVLINQLVKNSKGESTLRSTLVEATAEEIQAISFYDKGAGSAEIKVVRRDEGWIIESGKQEYNADNELIANMLNEVTTLKPNTLVATEKDQWAEYDVSDTSAIHVVLHGEKKTIADLFIGRFSYNQQNRKPTTFVRTAGDKKVYSVEGYLSMTFNRDINSLRNKSLFRGNRNDISRIVFNYPGDSSFILSKEGVTWFIDGSPVDSTATINYLNNIVYVIGSDFVDSYDLSTYQGDVYKMTIERNNLPSVEMTAYRQDPGCLVTSSENKGTIFRDGTFALYNKIFKGPAHFQPKL